MSAMRDLRERVRELDREILARVADRLEVVRAIGQRKRAAGAPLRDYDVERQVLDRADETARELQVPALLAREIMQALIAASRAEQERLSYSTYAGAAESILILGGRGKMGRWFADFFANQGHEVRVFDVADERAGIEEEQRPVGLGGPALQGVGFAVIATPLDVVARSIEQLAASGFEGIAFDIASLKGHLWPAIEAARRRGLRYTSVHPMFGPGARTLSDKVLCVCDCGDSEATARVRGLFEHTAATLVELSFERHDRIASHVLGLSHVTSILFAKTLMESGLSFAELDRVGSTTFHSQMVTTATVIRENPELYFAIQRLNPLARELYETMRRELESVTTWVLEGRSAPFEEMMQASREWMEGGAKGV
jgi:chorismate mutase/prephenate dehydrogenase